MAASDWSIKLCASYTLGGKKKEREGGKREEEVGGKEREGGKREEEVGGKGREERRGKEVVEETEKQRKEERGGDDFTHLEIMSRALSEVVRPAKTACMILETQQ